MVQDQWVPESGSGTSSMATMLCMTLGNLHNPPLSLFFKMSILLPEVEKPLSGQEYEGTMTW